MVTLWDQLGLRVEGGKGDDSVSISLSERKQSSWKHQDRQVDDSSNKQT